jgi:alkylation response protein AidB-like acyl-CoA dehydrogenase
MEYSAPHPSKYITKHNVAVIRAEAAEAEALGKLTHAQLEIVYSQQWFKMLVPQVYTGKQITLADLVRIQEAISWADGSMGWVVTLCSGAGWFGGFIEPDVARHVFNDDTVCLAGKRRGRRHCRNH